MPFPEGWILRFLPDDRVLHDRVAAGATGTLDVARKTIQADVGYGGGTYSQELAVSLVVPADSRAGPTQRA